MTANICIYTAIAGDYDDLKPIPPQIMAVDQIAFLDRQPMFHQGWQIVALEDEDEHPRMLAKHPKLMPHMVPELLGYDYTIWIDGSVEVTGNLFAAFMVNCIKRSGWAMYRHPLRDCIYDEAVASIEENPKKYAHLPMMEQVESYRATGMPEHWGLYQCTIIVRDMRRMDVKDAGLAWWVENTNWTYADQLSLTYVLWANGWAVDTIPGSVWHGRHHRLMPHRRDD